jgi:hypothetical protein
MNKKGGEKVKTMKLTDDETVDKMISHLPYEKHIGKDMYVHRETNDIERAYLKMSITKLLDKKLKEQRAEFLKDLDKMYLLGYEFWDKDYQHDTKRLEKIIEEREELKSKYKN